MLVPALVKTLAAATFCVTVLGFAVYGVVQLVGGDDNTDDGAKSPDMKASTPATDTPATQPSTAPTPSSSPTPTVPPKQKTTAPYPNEPLPLILTTPRCDNVAEVDFDRVPFSKWIDTSDLIDDYSPTEGTDMTWSGCAPQIWETMPEAHAGIVRKGTKLTDASCRAAANGGGLEFYRMWDGNPGFEKGANLCALTDKGRLVAAEVVDVKDGTDYAFTFDVTTVA
ncbi:hypothetical protein [Streptomyces sp. f51]|uniref:hypothetical protein n=1 Tax=Streptomyces sp. f51 TaxID=1827742 RepID=UPI000BF115E3|nr:hypothetical protein [Streptomyces sp. f51]